jgi:predicted secreted protein
MSSSPGRTVRVIGAAFLLGPGLAASVAFAGPTLSLSADARARVPNDEMSVTLAVEREAIQPGQPNEQVNRELADAIERARKVPGVQARLGQFWTQPVMSPQGRVTGYRVRGEVLLTSRNFAELGQLTGTLGARLQIAGVGFQVSNERRNEERARLIGQAAEAFRAKAKATAVAFGLRDYELRTLTLHDGGGPQPRMQAMPMAMADGARAVAAPLPVEGGDSEIVVGLSGSVELR